MSLCFSGIGSTVKTTCVNILVQENHSYVLLANALDWAALADLAVPDLKKTTPTLLWWLGRNLKVRIHLGVYILQTLTKMTDRGIEDAIRANAVYQIFCGRSIIEDWHCPDHTKIEKFRNRLSPEAQNKLNSSVVKLAEKLGFADLSKLDIDSTPQEANMAFPSDAALLTKLANMSKKTFEYLKQHHKKLLKGAKEIDIKKVKKKAKSYFFMAQNISKEKRQESFKDLYETVKEEVASTLDISNSIPWDIFLSLPWNIKRTISQIQEHGQKYLEDVWYFIKNQEMKPGKILSFHLKLVAYLKKGKPGKAKQFGRIFQLGRVGGNYLVAMTADPANVYLEDKTSLLPYVRQFQELFGADIIYSLGTDRGYWFKKIVDILKEEIPEVGIQSPGNVKAENDIDQRLKDRRAGIEPLIGHAKKFGLGKSRATSDTTILASGYRAILGFNLHQLTRHLTKPKELAII